MVNEVLMSYEDFYIKQTDINKKDLIRQINESNLDENTKKKIANCAERYSCTTSYVLDVIKREPIVAAMFAKDPKKQNIGEDYTLYVLNCCVSNGWLDEARKLGNKELWIYSGHIHEVPPGKGTGNDKIKSIDFYARCGKTHFYLLQKRNDGNGGAQTNAKNELCFTIDNARNFPQSEGIVMGIVDGSLYTDKVKAAMSEQYPHAKIIETDKLPEYFKGID